MGNMYNMIFGQNPMADVFLATLNLTRSDVGRFRDVYLEDGKICVYTRNGGGNRECWREGCSKDCTENCWSCSGEGACPGDCTGCIITERLPEHPNYLYDEDDDFDCTYATVYFSIPANYSEALTLLGDDERPDDVWQDFLGAMQKGEADPASSARGQVAARQLLLAIQNIKNPAG